jgi:hypothetical protein
MLEADPGEEMTLGQGFSTIVAACDLMSHLVNDVLNMSALEAGQLQVRDSHRSCPRSRFGLILVCDVVAWR